MRGDVRLRVECLLPEKLLARALAEGIAFSSLRREGPRTLVADLSAADARRLAALCGRFSVPCHVVSTRGGTALLGLLRRRWTVAFGLAVCLALCWLCLGRIWIIDVSFTGDAPQLGDRTLFTEAINAMGIVPGHSRDIDTERLSGELAAGAEGYSYVAARLEGIRLLVEAAPEVPAPEVYDLSDAHSLYADRSGIVCRVNVESGEACVKPGDTIARGQLLVRGVERASKEETRPIAARGEVVIRAWFEGAAEGRADATRILYTGRQSAASTLETPWGSIAINSGERYENEVAQAESIPIGGMFLPVRIVRTTFREVRAEPEPSAGPALEARLSAIAMADARVSLCTGGPKDYEIIRTWTRPSRTNGRIRVEAVIEITTNTAKTRNDILKGGHSIWKTSRFTIPNG